MNKDVYITEGDCRHLQSSNQSINYAAGDALYVTHCLNIVNSVTYSCSCPVFTFTATDCTATEGG